MAKKTATKTVTKGKKVVQAAIQRQDDFTERYEMVPDPLKPKRKTKQLVTSAPHFKFEYKGHEIACKVLSNIIPTEGEYADKLIGWNVVNIDTGETVMIGNTHQIEKAFTTENESGEELWKTGAHFLVTWLGKSNLGNGKTFNNFDIGLIED
jgi:hypothetical protein